MSASDHRPSTMARFVADRLLRFDALVPETPAASVLDELLRLRQVGV